MHNYASLLNNCSRGLTTTKSQVKTECPDEFVYSIYICLCIWHTHLYLLHVYLHTTLYKIKFHLHPLICTAEIMLFMYKTSGDAGRTFHCVKALIYPCGFQRSDATQYDTLLVWKLPFKAVHFNVKPDRTLARRAMWRMPKARIACDKTSIVFLDIRPISYSTQAEWGLPIFLWQLQLFNILISVLLLFLTDVYYYFSCCSLIVFYFKCSVLLPTLMFKIDFVPMQSYCSNYYGKYLLKRATLTDDSYEDIISALFVAPLDRKGYTSFLRTCLQSCLISTLTDIHIIYTNTN